MSEIIEEWLVDPDYTSRYKNLKRMKDSEGYKFIETPDPIKFYPSEKDRMYEVPPSEENRLDLVSYKMYGTVLYWWAIAMASNISNPLVVPAGTRLRVPPLEDVRGK